MYKLSILHAETLQPLGEYFSDKVICCDDDYFRDLLDEIFSTKGMLSYIGKQDIQRKGYNACFHMFNEDVFVKLSIEKIITPL